mmetsp:Transcript_46565/g.120148  ORF Transcript_46565/g.120148 Transcript_46565/m.120148 type:complete len:491 (-) Transcript_46565:116-1588(-)
MGSPGRGELSKRYFSASDGVAQFIKQSLEHGYGHALPSPPSERPVGTPNRMRQLPAKLAPLPPQSKPKSSTRRTKSEEGARPQAKGKKATRSQPVSTSSPSSSPAVGDERKGEDSEEMEKRRELLPPTSVPVQDFMYEEGLSDQHEHDSGIPWEHVSFPFNALHSPNIEDYTLLRKYTKSSTEAFPGTYQYKGVTGEVFKKEVAQLETLLRECVRMILYTSPVLGATLHELSERLGSLIEMAISSCERVIYEQEALSAEVTLAKAKAETQQEASKDKWAEMEREDRETLIESLKSALEAEEDKNDMFENRISELEDERTHFRELSMRMKEKADVVPYLQEQLKEAEDKMQRLQDEVKELSEEKSEMMEEISTIQELGKAHADLAKKYEEMQALNMQAQRRNVETSKVYQELFSIFGRFMVDETKPFGSGENVEALLDVVRTSIGGLKDTMGEEAFSTLLRWGDWSSKGRSDLRRILSQSLVEDRESQATN